MAVTHPGISSCCYSGEWNGNHDYVLTPSVLLIDLDFMKLSHFLEMYYSILHVILNTI